MHARMQEVAELLRAALARGCASASASAGPGHRPCAAPAQPPQPPQPRQPPLLQGANDVLLRLFAQPMAAAGGAGQAGERLAWAARVCTLEEARRWV
jgi:hypothetical protein